MKVFSKEQLFAAIERATARSVDAAWLVISNSEVIESPEDLEGFFLQVCDELEAAVGEVCAISEDLQEEVYETIMCAVEARLLHLSEHLDVVGGNA